ncbi:4970_t:CDS:2 [Acaulospora colombiana]|uniref:4970_t:CDS:1 n=1 Tax=Acaulospora colombiana TaxID=27376 RepID=A0ACA9KLU9_9GLOM|nr:4970_t:CDS:2 [Acaulospora colombiana]
MISSSGGRLIAKFSLRPFGSLHSHPGGLSNSCSKIILQSFISRGLTTSPGHKPGPTLQLKKDELDDFLPRERPESISYFTAKPTYNDLLIQLNDLTSKYKNFPRTKRDEKIVTLWKLKNQLEVDLHLGLKFNQYDLITQKLHHLDAIIPESAPELHDFLSLFRRQDPEKAKKELQANKKLDEYQRAYSVGKRKEAVAHVWVVEGEGHVLINGIPLVDYLGSLELRQRVLMPFQVTNLLGKYNVWVRVQGGGKSGVILYRVPKVKLAQLHMESPNACSYTIPSLNQLCDKGQTLKNSLKGNHRVISLRHSLPRASKPLND